MKAFHYPSKHVLRRRNGVTVADEQSMSMVERHCPEGALLRVAGGLSISLLDYEGMPSSLVAHYERLHRKKGVKFVFIVGFQKPIEWQIREWRKMSNLPIVAIQLHNEPWTGIYRGKPDPRYTNHLTEDLSPEPYLARCNDFITAFDKAGYAGNYIVNTGMWRDQDAPAKRRGIKEFTLGVMEGIPSLNLDKSRLIICGHSYPTEVPFTMDEFVETRKSFGLDDVPLYATEVAYKWRNQALSVEEVAKTDLAAAHKLIEQGIKSAAKSLSSIDVLFQQLLYHRFPIGAIGPEGPTGAYDIQVQPSDEQAAEEPQCQVEYRGLQSTGRWWWRRQVHVYQVTKGFMTKRIESSKQLSNEELCQMIN